MTVTKKQLLISELLPTFAQALKDAIKESIGDDVGFSLFIFDQEIEPRAQYISSCPREQVISVLTEFLERQQNARELNIPLHKLNDEGAEND